MIWLLAIIAIVAIVVLNPPFSTRPSCEQNLTRLSEALETFRNEHEAYPRSRHELVPRYLAEMPRCPSLDLDTYRIMFGRRAGYGSPEQSDYYLIRCTGQEHALVPRGFPAYDNVHGLLRSDPKGDS